MSAPLTMDDRHAVREVASLLSTAEHAAMLAGTSHYSGPALNSLARARSVMAEALEKLDAAEALIRASMSLEALP